jgi:transaldolase/glucose-6-phosphate isomerase
MANSIDYNVNENILKQTEQLLNLWKSEEVHERVWKKDPTVWRKDPAQQKELADRLGWLDLANTMQNEIPMLEKFSLEIKSEFEDVVLLGMGGSSLAPEVFFKTFGNKEGFPRLTILDSTHPLSIKNIIDNYNLKKTLFLVSSKSGGTVETMSFFYTFFDEIKKMYSKPGRHFVAITDPGSGLENLAKQNEFRKIFSTPSDVVGRYSAIPFWNASGSIDRNGFKIILSTAKEITDECKRKLK